jgi:hypothetical protein
VNRAGQAGSVSSPGPGIAAVNQTRCALVLTVTVRTTTGEGQPVEDLYPQQAPGVPLSWRQRSHDTVHRSSLAPLATASYAYPA